MLRGRLALRLLGGKEGETLAARVRLVQFLIRTELCT
jgi:hypothetical protein